MVAGRRLRQKTFAVVTVWLGLITAALSAAPNFESTAAERRQATLLSQPQTVRALLSNITRFSRTKKLVRQGCYLRLDQPKCSFRGILIQPASG